MNIHCNVTLPEYRSARITKRPSKFNFCSKCLQYRSGSIEWKCARGDCDNMLRFNTRIPLKFCSSICKRRNDMKTAVKSFRECIVCGKMFYPRRIGTQRMCGVKCNHRYTIIRRKINKTGKV